ncbi:MAG TPA: hypothetical protein VNY31_00805, partial [Solirubrobacteraceae bacterium]|nr:hypothetical protein [Solirubrobacteraceae bacterium]
RAGAVETSGETKASWRFTPASAPPPPAGVAPSSYPVPLGQVGDIEFWSPNRGLLITGGTGSSCAATAGATVPCGLYAYNGQVWHQLSSVCGGANGRIAWAGPDEFWTISDQRPGQVVLTGAEYGKISLCHFQDGKVVGSYAMPLNQPNSYLPMNAAACLSPSNCWFGGELAQPPSFGAFHLHWDGRGVSVVYSPEDHAVASMALAGPNDLLESVALAPEDVYGSESTSNPSLLHQIDPLGSSVDFHSLFIPDSSCAALEFCPPLPNYGTDSGGRVVEPDTLGPFSLGSDYSASGSNPAAPQLWAVAGANGREPSSSSAGAAHTIALRYFEGAWSQVLGGAGPGGDEPLGPEEIPDGVAGEPGAPAAWVTIHSTDGEAHLARLTAEGKLSGRAVLGEAQGVGRRGNAGPIACPATNDCWLATDQGWLFHLATEGAALPQDSDPSFAGVITFRPIDDGVPQLPSDEPQADNSLANQAPPPPPPPPPVVEAPALTHKALVTDLHSRVVNRYMLELSFRLTVKAHVQLLASHGKRRVAQTGRETLKAGKHILRLRLNPHNWPNKLNLKAIPLEALPTVPSAGTVSSGGGQATPGPTSSNNVST